MARITAQVTFEFGSTEDDDPADLERHAVRLLTEELARNHPTNIVVLNIEKEKGPTC